MGDPEASLRAKPENSDEGTAVCNQVETLVHRIKSCVPGFQERVHGFPARCQASYLVYLLAELCFDTRTHQEIDRKQVHTKHKKN